MVHRSRLVRSWQTRRYGLRFDQWGLCGQGVYGREPGTARLLLCVLSCLLALNGLAFAQEDGPPPNQDGPLAPYQVQNDWLKLSPGRVWGAASAVDIDTDGKSVSDVLQAPNGDIFVADGHDAGSNGRILKYDRSGKFLMQWGQRGSGPNDFNPPHGLAMDKEGRLYVADRGNKDVKVFDQSGKLLEDWKQFGTAAGVFVDKNDILYVADSNSTDKSNPGFHPGIRMAHVSDGKVFGYIPWPQTGTLEGVAVDDAGNIYGGFTNIPGSHRFVKN